MSLRADVVANERGWLALLPPAPLSALAVGQGDVYPNYIKVTARSLDALVSGDQIEHPLAVSNGQFDAAFVVLFLYPLLIFAVSFDLTATERDRGTLRMVLAQPVTLRRRGGGQDDRPGRDARGAGDPDPDWRSPRCHHRSTATSGCARRCGRWPCSSTARSGMASR